MLGVDNNEYVMNGILSGSNKSYKKKQKQGA